MKGITMGRYLQTIIGTITTAISSMLGGKVHDGSSIHAGSLLSFARTVLRNLGPRVPARVPCSAWRPGNQTPRAGGSKS
jgi:hypothetical protein